MSEERGNSGVYSTQLLEQQVAQPFFRKKKNHFYYVLSLLNSKKSNKKELLPSILPYQNPQGKMKKKREEGKEGNSTGKETDKLLCLN